MRSHDCNPRESVGAECCRYSALLITIRYPDGVTEPKSVRQMHTFASQMSDKLSEWRQSLPISLAVDEFDNATYFLPHVLQLQ